MPQEPHQLDYQRAGALNRRRRGGCGLMGRLAFLAALLLVGMIIIGLYSLETMPYRPPYDMSTFLGGPELTFVRALKVFFFVVWCVLLICFVISLRPQEPNP